MISLLIAWDRVEPAALEKLRARLVIVKADVRLDALTADIEHPIVIADARARTRFTADGYRFDGVRQIFRNIHSFEQGLADDGFMLYRQTEIDRKSVVSHFLIFGRYRDRYVFVAVAPILGDAITEAVDPLGDKEKVAVASFLHYPPGVAAPDVGVLEKEIRGKAGEKESSRWMLVFTASVFLYGLEEG